MMEVDLVTRLKAANLVAGSVSWDERPKAGFLPSLTLTLVDPGRGYTMEGAREDQEARIQVDVWAATNLEARQIEAAVIAFLETAATAGTTKFAAGFLNGSPNMPPETLDGGQKVFRRSPDFSIFHQPA